jgi:hypothetical protein
MGGFLISALKVATMVRHTLLTYQRKMLLKFCVSG